MTSEFPKDFYVSLILLMFSLILMTLASEVVFFLCYSLQHTTQLFDYSSFAYFMAYVLVNFLFMAHLSMYFGYREEVKIEDESLVLQQRHLIFMRKWKFSRDELLYYRLKKGLLGTYHIELFYLGNKGQTKKLHIGTYLHEEHLLVLSHVLKQFVF